MRLSALLLLAWLLCIPAQGQETPPPSAPQEISEIQDAEFSRAPAPQAEKRKEHRFWDRKNSWLFAGVAASRGLDFASTRNMRARGRDEILLTNEMVDNRPLFIAIEAAGAAASIGLSYWLHRTGHHKLERWASLIHIGVTTGGAARNYMLKSNPYRHSAP